MQQPPKKEYNRCLSLDASKNGGCDKDLGAGSLFGSDGESRREGTEREAGELKAYGPGHGYG